MSGCGQLRMTRLIFLLMLLVAGVFPGLNAEAKTPVPAPLTGTVTSGSWAYNQEYALSGGPSSFGSMQYNILLPQGYAANSSIYTYPLMIVGAGNDQGMNGSTYPRDGASFIAAMEADSLLFNTVAFRTAHPAIIVAVQCDQSLDTSGATTNSNCGGYADTPNGTWNEQAISKIAQFMITNYSVDTSRVYCVGPSLMGIGCLAQLVDNNKQYMTGGSLQLITAAVGFSDQLTRPTIPNSTVFSRMAAVPFFSVCSPGDNPCNYDLPLWQNITGNTSYPVKANYDAGIANARAGSSNFYLINTSSGTAYGTFGCMNADGCDGTQIYAWLFSQSTGGTPTESLGVVTPGQQTLNTSFPVNGTIQNVTSPPTLQYAIGTGTSTPTATPGSGSITDGTGNVYAITSAGAMTLNGTAIVGGGGTSEIAFYSNTVYAQDASNLSWFTYTPSGGFVASGAPVLNPGTLGPYNALPGGSTVTTSTFSFSVPGLSPAGVYSISVRDANNTGVTASTNTFNVVSSSPSCTASVNNTIVKSGNSGVITDGGCNLWTVPVSNGQVLVNGIAVSGTSSVAQINYVNENVWQQSGGLWSYLTPGPKTGATSAAIGPTFSLSPLQTNWWIDPGQDGYFWKLPFQTTAQWLTSGSSVTLMRNGPSHSSPYGFAILYPSYSTPFYIGQATDPLVTVTQGSNSFQVHLPLGAIPESPFGIGTDTSIGGVDVSQPGLMWSNSGVQLTVNGSPVNSVQATGTVITGTYGIQKDWAFGPILEDAVTGQPGFGNSYGVIQDYELTAANADASYIIPHMLALQMDIGQVNTSIVWPVTVADGGATYTGSLPQGLTLGIPASTSRPGGMTRGQALLFDTMQHYGGVVYNFGPTGGTTFQIYSTDSANAALQTDMVNNAIQGGGPGGSSWIMQYMAILNNQTGLSSQKGQVGGVRSDAFSPPPPLSLQPTGYKEVNSTAIGAYLQTTKSGFSAASGGYTAPAPLLVGPASLNAPLGAITAVPGLSSNEIWYAGDTMTFTGHSSGSGKLSATGATGNGTGTITFTGSVSQTNTMLATLTFQDSVPENPTLYFTIYDQHSNINTVSTAVTSGNTCPASPNNTVLSASTTSVITDGNGQAWGLPKSGGQVFLQGTALPGTSRASQLAYVNNVVWYQNTSNQWYSFNSSGGIASGPTTNPLQITVVAPANLAATQGQGTLIQGIVATDAAYPGDNQTFSGSSTGNGKLAATGASGNGTGTITFTGSLTALNSLLASVTFTDAVTENPTISYSVMDAHSLSASTTTAVTVSSSTVPSTGTTWNPSAVGSGGTLSNNNSTMTTGGGGANVLSTSGKGSGKACFAVTAGTLSFNWAAGLATAAQALSGSYLGGTGSPSEGLYASYGGTQSIFVAGGTPIGITGAPSSAGDVILEAVDFDSGLFWVTDKAMAAAGYPWNDSATANPVGEIGGLSLSGLGAGPYFMAAGAQESGSVFNLNPVPTGCPAGFPTWDTPLPTGGPSPWTVTLQ